MSRPSYTRASILMEDAPLTVTTPDGTNVTVSPTDDPSSLDITVPSVPPADGGAPVTVIEDPEMAAMAAALSGDDDLGTTVTIDQPGGLVPTDDANVAPEVTPDTDVGTADEIADATADAVDDSADEIAQSFENAEQRLLLAQDIGLYGLTAGGFAVGRQLGLLTGASFEGMSSESLQMSPIEAGSRECGMSQESLITSAAKAVGDFGARAVSHSSGVVKRLLNMATKEELVINKMLTGAHPTPAAALSSSAQAHMGDVVSRARSAGRAFGVGEAIRNLGKTAGKAAIRPRNAAIAVAIVGAIAGTTKLVQTVFKGAPAPGTPVAEMQGWFSKVRQQVAAIKWPFGKLTVKDTAEHVASPSLRDRIGRLFCKDRPVTSARDAVSSFAQYRVTAKEWTASSIKAFKDGFTRAMSDLKAALTGGGEGFVRTISNGIKAGGGEGATRSAVVLSRGAYVTSVFAVFALMASVVFFVVAGGCRIIRRQLEG